MCSRKCWIVSFFYSFLHLPHRQFSFIDLCLSSKMYWTFNCSWDNVMKWNVFFFCVLHIFQNFPCTLGEKSKSVSFLRVYVCVKAKLTLVSFFTFFHAPSPKGLGWLRGLSGLISLLYIYCHMVRTPLGIGYMAFWGFQAKCRLLKGPAGHCIALRDDVKEIPCIVLYFRNRNQ